MGLKAQGALEYLLLIGGAVLVAAVVLSLITGLAEQGGKKVDFEKINALCASFPERDCGVKDPDGIGELRPTACKKETDAAGKFLRCIAA